MAELIRDPALAGLVHGFSTRHGADEAIAALPARGVVRARQVHSATALIADRVPDAPPECDAFATATPGLLLAIVTADCAPVLFADSEAGVVGAAHAGWRGAVGGVLENTLAAMVALGARPGHTVAVIGPTIAQSSYEVEARFAETLGPDGARFLAPGRADHAQFDLPGYVAMRLRAAGVGTVRDLGLDTYADPARFFSYRRATHRGEPTGGRQVSVIALPA